MQTFNAAHSHNSSALLRYACLTDEENVLTRKPGRNVTNGRHPELMDSRQLDHLRVFHEVARALTANLELEPLLRAILPQMEEYFGPDGVLHVQADQLPAGHDYLKLSLADGTNADFASAVAILTGVRYQGESNPSATV